jgi:hypothetical protein
MCGRTFLQALGQKSVQCACEVFFSHSSPLAPLLNAADPDGA